jgi:hypothetical protein
MYRAPQPVLQSMPAETDRWSSFEMQDEQWPSESIIDMMIKLSEGDVSVLAGAVTKRASMVTAPDSGNYKFWAKLAEIGLLKEDGSFLGAELADTRIFSVVQDGVARLEKLLETYRRRLLFTKMSHFLATECEPFAVKLVESVKSARGGSGDVIYLMGFTLYSVLAKCLQPKDSERVIQAVADLARKQLISS